jgi:RHS repeat-associated protein
MGMPGRSYKAASGYRYGFNGKENDNEVKGDGNQQDYGMRIYDVRLGRFLSVDPLTITYPFFTPYQFASNLPIAAIDLDGEESKITIIATNQVSSSLALNDETKIGMKTIQQRAIIMHLFNNLKNRIIESLNANSTGYKTLTSLGSGFITNEEIDNVIYETIYFTLNFTETINTGNQHTFSGEKIAEFKTGADINYNAFGGESFIKELSDIFVDDEKRNSIIDSYEVGKGLTGYEDITDKLKNKLEEKVLKSIKESLVKARKEKLAEQILKQAPKILKHASILLDIAEGLIGELGTGDTYSEIKPGVLKEIATITIIEILNYFIQDGSNLPIYINPVEKDKVKIDNTYNEKPKQ